MANLVTLNVLDLYLDPENPRHEPIQNQPEIIAHLLQNELVRNLAKDVAANGLSPLEVIGVIKEKSGQYVVVEGNRRTCALILLNDPDLCHNNEQAKYFRKISNSSSKYPSQVNCVLFESRDDAYIWIERRHEGEQGGIGTRPWDAVQKTRQSLRKGKKDENALAQSLIDYAKKYNFLPAKLEGKYLTTTSRFLGNPFFRETLGIVSGKSSSDVVINVAYNEFDRVLEEFCGDLVDKESAVNSRAKKNDIRNYADNLIKLGIAPTKQPEKKKLEDKPLTTKSDPKEGEGVKQPSPTGITSPNPSPTTSPTGGAIDSPKPPQGGVKRDPDSRPYLFPSTFKPTIHDNILRRVFREIKRIEVDEMPLSVAMLARVFLENIYSMYYEKNHGYAEMQTHQFIEKIAKIIQKDENLSKPEKNALKALKAIGSSEDNQLNPKSLGASAHGGRYPSARELKRGWDNISPIIEYIIKRI